MLGKYFDEDKLLQEMHAHAAVMLLCTHIHKRTAIPTKTTQVHLLMSSLLPLFLVLGQPTCLVRSARRVATAIHSLTHRDAGIGKRRARGEGTSDLSTVPGQGCGGG